MSTQPGWLIGGWSPVDQDRIAMHGHLTPDEAEMALLRDHGMSSGKRKRSEFLDPVHAWGFLDHEDVPDGQDDIEDNWTLKVFDDDGPGRFPVTVFFGRG